MAFPLFFAFSVWSLIAIFGFKVFRKDTVINYPKLALSFLIVFGLALSYGMFAVS